MIVKDVMDELAARLDTIAGLNVLAFPTGAVHPPAAVVGLPSTVVFDKTYGRGSDTMVIPVLVVFGKPDSRSARDAFSAYASGSGPKSVKAVLEANPTAYLSMDGNGLHVRDAETDVVTLGGTDYAAALFNVDVIGPGSD